MIYAELIANALFIFLSGCLGAYLSQLIKQQGLIWPYFISGLCTILSWIWVAKRSPHNLLISSIYWDVIYNIAWIGFAVVVLKQASSVWQIVGAVIVLVGLAIMGL